MIRKVYIKNYALIEEVSVSFSNGFTVITGETGAGKSILLSALQLALGNRLENKNLFDSTKKCIVEIEIDIPESFENWFITNDVDYAAQSIIRRELLPSGKSRLFINDSPINQGDLRLLMDQLISIHSQHEAYTLLQPSEQLRILDDFSDTLGLATEFKVLVQTYRALVDKRDKLAQSQSEEEKKWDYLSFIKEELERAQVDQLDINSLEQEQQTLAEVDSIRSLLSESQFLMSDDELGILSQLSKQVRLLSELNNKSGQFSTLYERIQSCFIELKDIYTELERSNDSIVADPNRLDELNTTLSEVYRLQQKHKLADFSELHDLYTTLCFQLSEYQPVEDQLKDVGIELLALEQQIDEKADKLLLLRQKGAKILTTELENVLSELGMPSAELCFEFNPSELSLKGKHEIDLKFRANKGGSLQPLKSAISGGELSRLSLAMEYVRSKIGAIPAQIFDEIDSGVSGNVADKIAQLFCKMGESVQLIVISHLPQVASKASQHFKISKTEDDTNTRTSLQLLSDYQREKEIAIMLEGLNPSKTALMHAKSLLARS